MLAIVASLAERFGKSDWGRIFVVATAAFGTMLTPFAVVLNNHTIAAVSAAVALYAFTRIWFGDSRQWRWFALAGLAGAFTAANELPALAFFALLTAAVLWKNWRLALVGFAPFALLVLASSFGTNYWAHDSWRPPYAHRSATDPEDNWYHYSYELGGKERQSYWLDPQGIDKGEPSKLDYALHCFVGHHGIFSLTPVWLLSAWGAWLWLRGGTTGERQLAAGIALLTVVVLTFYIGLRPQIDRNYGGMTSGLRWLFWLAPLWLVVMLPAADRMAQCRRGMSVALVLLAFSALSASYPTWNPWIQPWIYNWLQSCGWRGFS
jgi:MFS family permease